MNKKNNRKGFTTVELVIVIAVIAILATVLIPTFSNLIEKANESAALQEATNAVKFITMHNADPANTDIADSILKVGDYYFGMIGGQLVKATKDNDGLYTIELGNKDYTFKIANNAISELKYDTTEGYTATTENTTPVADLNTTKVKVYPIVAPTNP